MYCPSCGSELTSELSYCNRCGANLKPLSNQSAPPARMVGATWAISMAVVLVTLGGFGMMFGLVMALISNGVNLSGGGMVLIVFSLLIILAIASLLVRQLSRVLDVSQLSGGATQSKQPKQGEKTVQQIGAPREPVSSVTEHTTQMFEPIHRERDTQR
jgi:Na+-transporting methylmalonyl-CoA/oxaloacetate decarboxylase gamma subunit